MNMEPGPSRNIPFSLVMLVLFISIAMTYFNSIKSPFYYDDIKFIRENEGLARADNIKHLFNREKYFELFGERTYRPVTTVIYFALKSAFGNQPAMWRLFNLALHFFNCSLLFLILRRFKLDDWLAALAVTIFAVHPIHTEIFNIVSYNEELIGGLFFLLAFYWYFKEGGSWFSGSLVMYFLSCFVKEIFVLLPVLCLGASLFQQEQAFSWKRLFKKQAGYLIIAFVFLFVTFVAMKNPGMVRPATYPGGSLYTAMLTFLVVLTYYLKLFFWPVGLTPIYNFPISASILDWPVIFALIIVGSLVGLMIYGLVKKKSYAFCLFWFFLFILPASNIIPFGAILAERYLYIPLMGLTPGSLLLVQSALKTRGINERQPILIAGMIFLTMLGVLTVKRNLVWHNPETLWQDTIKKAPNTIKPHANLGLYYFEQKEYGKAITEYLAIEKIKKIRPQDYYNMGNIYLKLGMFEQARKYYEISLRERRNNVSDLTNEFKVVMNLGVVYLNLKDYETALKYLDLARALRPDYANTYYNLKLVYEKLGLTKQAQKAGQAYSLRK